ncbi:MAG: hypothetical protein HW416_1937 [Chloroflexi bacterium]|nr:hypothetical protein [Chloroflexota bacterium]
MVAASRVTLELFLNMEETEPYSEYACGKVFAKPMPDRAHSTIQRFFVRVLCQFLERTPLGEVFPEFRCVFGPSGRERAFVPDLTYVAKEQLTADRYHMAPPDLAIEILSPDQNMSRFLDKIQFYLLNGVRLLLSPLATRSTEVICFQAFRFSSTRFSPSNAIFTFDRR